MIIIFFSVNGVAIPETNNFSFVLYSGFPTDTDTLVGISIGAAAIWEIRVTVNVVEPWFPEVSIAVQVTVVGPIGKNEPEAGVHWGPDSIATLSVTLGGSYVTVAPFDVLASTVMFCFFVNAGGWLSPTAFVLITLTVNELVPTFPALSDAVQTTEVAPTRNKESDGGVHVGLTVTPMLSVARGGE